MAREISNTDDVIDSRDVIARIEELEEERAGLVSCECFPCLACTPKGSEETLPDLVCGGCGQCSRHEQHTPECKGCPTGTDDLQDWDAENGAELAAIKSLADEAEGYAADWYHGSTLIRDSYFEDYARELAEDLHGRSIREAAWPFDCISWEAAAEALQQDYTSVDFDGVTYWVR